MIDAHVEAAGVGVGIVVAAVAVAAVAIALVARAVIAKVTAGVPVEVTVTGAITAQAEIRHGFIAAEAAAAAAASTWRFMGLSNYL